MHPYAAHSDFIRPAWPARQIWRVLVMMVAFEVVFVLSFEIFAAFLPGEAAVNAFYEGTTTFGTLAQFFAFGISAMGFLLLLHLLHARGFWSLIGPYQAARRDLIRVGLGVSAVLLVLEIVPPWVELSALAEVRDLGVWLSLIPITLTALLIQVGTEEMVFRGYLQQQFACISSSRWVWMGVPSVMFGSVHYWNGNGAAEGISWAIWATVLGMACADLTARSGNLGAAIGLHMANNAFALLVVSVQGWPSSGVALFLYPYEDPALYAYGAEALFAPWYIFQLLVMLVTVYVMWLAARIAIKR